ncbi:MAG TPA: 50S ribosomal protein L25 [Acidobacteriota bacterium]|nr:50S ribosomal protein L25 [Acidobacteriota bacterium]
MTDTQLLEVELREPGSSNKAKQLRRAGKVPAVLYGGDRDTRAISVNPRSLIEILRSEHGQNSILSLKVGDGAEQTALIHDYQVDPISRKLQHVDFRRIDLKIEIEVNVPVEVVGEAVGVKVDRGILDMILREVHVKCLPTDIPDHLKVDVSEFNIGDVAQVSDLEVPDNVELLVDLDQTVLTIAPPTVEIEEEVVEDDEDLLAGPEEPVLIGHEDEEESEDDE